MPLLEQPLWASNESSHVLWNLDLGAREALEGDDLLPSLQPALDNFPLAAGGYACHFFNLCGRVPLLIHCI